MEKNFTINQVAERLNVHPKTVYNLLDRHELSGIKVGRVWRISEKALEEYISRNSYFNKPLALEESEVCESVWQDYMSAEQLKLPDHIAKKFQGKKIELVETNEGILIKPIEDPIRILRGFLEGGQFTTDVYLRQKREEKELEL